MRLYIIFICLIISGCGYQQAKDRINSQYNQEYDNLQASCNVGVFTPYECEVERRRIFDARVAELNKIEVENNKKLTIISLSPILILGAGAQANANHQGCCSYHGGIQGCYEGHVICNDDKQSPTCQC